MTANRIESLQELLHFRNNSRPASPIHYLTVALPHSSIVTQVNQTRKLNPKLSLLSQGKSKSLGSRWPNAS